MRLFLCSALVILLQEVVLFSEVRGLEDVTEPSEDSAKTGIEIAPKIRDDSIEVHVLLGSDESHRRCGSRPNEQWYKCRPLCQRTCHNLRAKCSTYSPEYDCKSGCDCKPGYARLTEGHPCQKQNICPGKSPDRNKLI